MATINFTKEKFDEFKKVYQQAVKDKQEVFIFEGNEFLPDYAKYLIQYLETKF